MATIRSNRVNDNTAAGGESWTPERRERAIPKPLPTLDPDERPPADTEKPAAGEERVEPGVAPENPPTLPQKQKAAVAAEDTIAQPVSNPLQAPYVACGKLFFSQGGTDYVGSAAAMANNMLLTAGHCIYEGGNWSSDVAFYPAYPYLPFTIYTATWGATYFDGASAWTYDFGIMWVPAGMQATIGTVGWAANVVPASSVTINAVGYPAAAPFPGNVMYQASGNCINAANPMEMDNNDMTPGCSGGPWIINNNGQQCAIGVNSFRYSNQLITMWSPQFGQDFLSLLAYVQANHP